MNCLQCGHDNPATLSYCQKCGGKLDLTADQISASLFEKKKGEQQKSTEFYARQSLYFAIVAFLIGLAIYVLSGGAPQAGEPGEPYHIPSATHGGRHLRHEYKVDKPVPRADLPFPGEKK